MPKKKLETKTVEKTYTAWEGSREFGRVSIYIDCPFCGTRVEAFKWSLYGSGKRCPGCGAKHGGVGQITRKEVPIEKEKRMSVVINNTKYYVSLQEAGDAIGVAKRTVKEWIDTGKLEAISIQSQRSTRPTATLIKAEDIAAVEAAPTGRPRGFNYKEAHEKLVDLAKRHPEIAVRDAAPKLGITQGQILDLIDSHNDLLYNVGIKAGGGIATFEKIGDYTIEYVGE